MSQTDIQKIFRAQLQDDDSASQLAGYFIQMAEENKYETQPILDDIAETLRGSGADDEMIANFAPLAEQAIQILNPTKAEDSLSKKVLKLNINSAPAAAAAGGKKAASSAKKPKNVSGWTVYLEHVRDEVKAEFESANPGKVYKEDWPAAQKKASDTWKAMKDSEKQPFLEKASERKRELGIESKGSGSKPESEKRAESAYQKFIEIEGAKFKGTGKNVMKELGPQWKSMKDNAKQKYQDLADASNREKGRMTKTTKSANKGDDNKQGVKVTAWTVFCQEYKTTWETLEGDKKEKSTARSNEWAEIKKEEARHQEYVEKADTINAERGIPIGGQTVTAAN